MEESKLTEKEIEEIKNYVIHTFACEGMTLTEKDIQNGDDILTGRKSADQIISEVIQKFREEGSI